MTNQSTRLSKIRGTSYLETGITIGKVIDTNDPQQMGRLRVFCAAFGDSDVMSVIDIPWSMYASPFAGASDLGTRGRGQDPAVGPVAYGMWNIPKIGSHVLVTCIDGDPSQRVWFAGVYPDYLTHTMPHGRFTYSTQETGKPEGPLSSTEQPINPLYNNQTEAFTNTVVGVDPRQSYEFRTRGADYQAAFLNGEFKALQDDPLISNLGDDRNTQFTEPNGETITSNQGYAKSRIEPNVEFPNTDGTNYDSQVYGWTTPGFHAFSMADRPENCRVRIRTTGGHQIIMDDTNERIYISTLSGQTFIELDEKGTIDIYSTQTMSFRAEGDINFTTDKTFRVTAKEGIHLASEGQMRLDAKGGDLSIHTSQSLRMHSNSNSFLQSDGMINLLATSDINVDTGGTLNLLASSNINVDTDGTLNLLAAGNILQTGAQIQLNGPTAGSANPANPANTTAAYYASRVPQHEPFARVYNTTAGADNDTANSFTPEYSYNDPAVGTGSADRDIKFNRNPLWKR